MTERYFCTSKNLLDRRKPFSQYTRPTRPFSCSLSITFWPIGPSRTASASTAAETAALGYLHCGPSGAGHFVKMIHNGIEYGIMAAYAEGMGILAVADAGERARTLVASHTARVRYRGSLRFSQTNPPAP